MKLGAWVGLMVALGGLVFAEEDLARREAELLKQVKAENGKDAMRVEELARVREARGNYQSAIDTWGLLKKLHGKRKADVGGSVAPYAYGELADFWMQRLRRKQNLAANPPKADLALRGRLGRAAFEFCQDHAWLGEQGGITEFAAQADMDGDLIDEVFVVGREYPDFDAKHQVVALAKWDGTKYAVVWTNRGKDDKGGTPIVSFEVYDLDGDGWKEIRLGFSNEPGDDTIIVQFNGQTVLV